MMGNLLVLLIAVAVLVFIAVDSHIERRERRRRGH